MAAIPPHTVNKTAGTKMPDSVRRLAAEADKAAARAELAKQQLRAAKADLKKARKLSRAAKKADVVVLALGESAEMSGEGGSRSRLDLPGNQEKLLERPHGVVSSHKAPDDQVQGPTRRVRGNRC